MVILNDWISVFARGDEKINVRRKWDERYLFQFKWHIKQNSGRNFKVTVCIDFKEYGQGILTFINSNFNSEKYTSGVTQKPVYWMCEKWRFWCDYSNAQLRILAWFLATRMEVIPRTHLHTIACYG